MTSKTPKKTTRTPRKAKTSRALKQPNVLVIGAGVAGLAAARALRAAGIAVTVLEARDRIGGRAWTDHSLGLPLDMGASWIHGVLGNPISEIAQAHQIETRLTDYSGMIYDGRHQPLLPAEASALYDRLDTLLSKADILRQSLKANGEPDQPLGSALEQLLAAEGPLLPYAARKLEYAIASQIEHEYAADVDEMSLYHWDEPYEFKGDDAIFPEGYVQIMMALAAGLKIRLNHQVTKIEYGPKQVTVTSSAGVFQANRVIVTLPLGVLKAGAVEFAPALPKRKQAAIRNLGMGLLNKLYLRFDRVFWPIAPDLIGYVAERKGEWAEMLNLYKYLGVPILVCFNAANYGRILETFPDSEVVAKAMRALRTMFGASIPDPLAYAVTRWASDPFAGGSYSYLPPGATAADRQALAEPVNDRLFFAGEAATTYHPATVHGAFLSGVRAAEKLLTSLKR